MITFDKKQSVVKLSNGSISYWIYINREGYLETVYFGKTVKDFDISLIRVTGGVESNIFSINQKREIAYIDRYKEGIAPVELSVHGRRDKRDAPIVIQRENGSLVTDFIYVSHKIFDGAVQLDNLPCAHGDNCQTVEFLLKERSQEIYLKHRVTIFDDKDIIVKNFEIINKTVGCGNKTGYVHAARFAEKKFYYKSFLRPLGGRTYSRGKCGYGRCV